MNSYRSLAALLTIAAFAACGADDAQTPDMRSGMAAASSSPAPSATPLTAIELEQGVGPIRDLALGDIDHEMAERGEAAFVVKCSACHKLEERYVAPPLGEVLSRRRPEFVMNMILNASEMVQRHPEVQKLLAEYYTPMPVQVTDQTEARAILEYLRSEQHESQ